MPDQVISTVGLSAGEARSRLAEAGRECGGHRTIVFG